MNIGLNVEVLVNRQPAVIAFDGDDTLWVDGMREQAWERRFRHLAADRLPSNEMATRFRSLLDEFGFTVNGVQRALLLSGRECCPERLSNEWLAQVEALPELVAELDIRPKGGAADLIDHLGRAGHELWIITKGDLIRQAIKVAMLEYTKRFSRIEIVSRKDKGCYAGLLARHDVTAERFVMIGDSFLEDVLPVAGLHGRALHVPAGGWALVRPLEGMLMRRGTCAQLGNVDPRCF